MLISDWSSDVCSSDLRPIKKSNGSWTYFGADLAYHYQKAQSADQLIDIWGADHAGTVKRIQAAVRALTHDKVPFDVKLVQMVRLLSDGEPVKMRSAERRVGKEWGSKCRARWRRYHYKKKIKHTKT